MKKLLASSLILVLLTGAPVSSVTAAEAKTEENGATYGRVSLKTVAAGLASFLVWPGIGQVINDNKKKKAVTHAILGLTQIFRFWSGWDALVDRHGGFWKGKI